MLINIMFIKEKTCSSLPNHSVHPPLLKRGGLGIFALKQEGRLEKKITRKVLLQGVNFLLLNLKNKQTRGSFKALDIFYVGNHTFIHSTLTTTLQFKQ